MFETETVGPCLVRKLNGRDHVPQWLRPRLVFSRFLNSLGSLGLLLSGYTSLLRPS